MPEISVLMPVRNGAQTLALAMLSVLRQSCGDFELLVIDDGSSDATSAIAAGFGDPRVRLLADGAHRGLAARLNQGIDAAAGRYIARMDADDICFPERFAKQLARLQDDARLDLVGCRTLDFAADGTILGERPYRLDHASLCARPWNGFYIVHPSWFARTAWFRRHRYRTPELVRAQDQELLLRACPESSYAVVDEILLGYRATPLALRKLLSARRCLLAAQLGIFGERGEWGNFVLALLATLAKLPRDLLSPALPKRAPAAVAPEVEAAWRALLVSLERELGERNLPAGLIADREAKAYAS